MHYIQTKPFTIHNYMSETKHIHRAYISNSQTRTQKSGISWIKFIINVRTVTRIQIT